MFTYRQLLIVAVIASFSQIVFQFIFKSEPDIKYMTAMIIGFFTLILNVWLLELIGFFFKESTQDNEVKNG